MAFLHKRVREGDSSFGSDLRDLRDLRGVSFEEACRATRIDRRILQALENDRVEDFADPIFFERHLMAYVKYLGGYEPYFRIRYADRITRLASVRKVEDLLPRIRKIGFFDLFAAPQLLAFLGILAFAGLLGGYVLWQAHSVSTSPALAVERPRDGERLTVPRVSVRGQTSPEATVAVNERDAPVAADGSFGIDLDVPRGTTVVTIVAKRRRGSETRIVRRVIYERSISETDRIGITATGTADEAVTSTISTPIDSE